MLDLENVHIKPSLSINVDIEVLKKRFEDSEASKRFKEIIKTSEFKEAYHEQEDAYGQYIAECDSLIGAEKKALTNPERLWDSFYATLICRLNVIAIENFLNSDVPIEETIMSYQDYEYYIDVFSEMLVGWIDVINETGYINSLIYSQEEESTLLN